MSKPTVIDVSRQQRLLAMQQHAQELNFTEQDFSPESAVRALQRTAADVKMAYAATNQRGRLFAPVVAKTITPEPVLGPQNKDPLRKNSK